MRGKSLSFCLAIGSLLFTIQLAQSSNINVAVAPFTNSFPNCMDAGQKMAINNQRVIEFKRTSPNQFLARGFVAGVVIRIFDGNRGHITFEIKIGNGADDTLEVIFNDKFGKMTPEVGMPATICGDYITSNAATNRYPASPSGAIIHWVHENPDNQGHDHGFVELGGWVYGQISQEVLEYPHFPRFKQGRGSRPLFLLPGLNPGNVFSTVLGNWDDEDDAGFDQNLQNSTHAGAHSFTR